MGLHIEINPWAVLISGFGSLALGFFWLSSPRGIFGKAYSRAMYGRSAEQAEEARRAPMRTKAMKRSFPLFIVFSLVSAAVFAVLLATWRAAAPAVTGSEATLAQGLLLTLLLWGGYTFPHALGKVVWQFKPWTVVWIECGNELLRALLMLLLFWYWR